MPRRFPSPLWLCLLFLLAPLAYALIANHAWEDYFITLRASRNLVLGNGLVFTPGEKLHTFTSPLGVLLPALCTAVVGVNNEQQALWLFRLCSMAVLCGAGVLLWRRLTSLNVSLFARLFCVLLIALDAKLTGFSMAGMETALMAFFVILLWSALEDPEGPSTSRVAMAVGGLMWTRPDACVIGAALIIPHLVRLVRNAWKAGKGRGATPLPALVRGILLGGLLYVPWFAWAWWYYGSPVPHTIVAKAEFAATPSLALLYQVPLALLSGGSPSVDLFLPPYWFLGGWPSFLVPVISIPVALACLLCLLPWTTGRVRRLSFATLLGAYYLASIIAFPWYQPPWLIVLVLTLALMLDDCLKSSLVSRFAWLASLLRVYATALIGLQVCLLAACVWQVRIQQQWIENTIRRPIGEYLRAQANPGDTVFLEPLGYIGYYSNLKTLDIPGLSSLESVAAVRAGNRSFSSLVEVLRPDWVVARPQETVKLTTMEFFKEYELVQTWDVRAQLDALPLVPGRGWIGNDAVFTVYRRSRGKTVPLPIRHTQEG